MRTVRSVRKARAMNKMLRTYDTKGGKPLKPHYRFDLAFSGREFILKGSTRKFYCNGYVRLADLPEDTYLQGTIIDPPHKQDAIVCATRLQNYDHKMVEKLIRLRKEQEEAARKLVAAAEAYEQQLAKERAELEQSRFFADVLPTDKPAKKRQPRRRKQED